MQYFLERSMELVQRILWIMTFFVFFCSLIPCACSCSVSSLVLLGAFLGIDGGGGGVSQSMNLIWHNSIKMQVHRILSFFFFFSCSNDHLGEQG